MDINWVDLLVAVGAVLLVLLVAQWVSDALVMVTP